MPAPPRLPTGAAAPPDSAAAEAALFLAVEAVEQERPDQRRENPSWTWLIGIRIIDSFYHGLKSFLLTIPTLPYFFSAPSNATTW